MNNRPRGSDDSQQPPKTAKEVIAANVQSLIEQLEAGHSEALTAYLNAMGRFHNYSFGNILEIARQRPDATSVAGMYAWNQLGRRVKKGERGIRILTPIIGVRRKPTEEAEKDITKQNKAVLVGFRAPYVFDVSQTEGRELPKMREIRGSVGENRERLLSFIECQGNAPPLTAVDPVAKISVTFPDLNSPPFGGVEYRGVLQVVERFDGGCR